MRQPATQAVLAAGLMLTPFAAHAQDDQVPEPPSGSTFDLSAAIAEGPPMTADRAASIAVERAPAAEEAEALVRAADATIAQARARILPRLELSGRAARIDGFPDGSIPITTDPDALEAARRLAEMVEDPAARALWQAQIATQGQDVRIAIPRNQFALSARLTWPVSDVLLAVLPTLDAAEAQSRAQELERDAALRRVALSAREAFYMLARARGSLAVAHEAERQAIAQREQIRAGVRAGFLTEADGLSADSRVAQAQQAVANAEAAVVVADAALRVLLGDGSDGGTYGIAEDVVGAAAEQPGDRAALTQRALDERPELAGLQEALDAQRASARASDAAAYPHLGVYAGADYALPNRYVVPPRERFDGSWEVGVTLTWSPNDGLQTLHRGDELRARYEATEAQLAQVADAVRLEVRQAHAEAVAATRSLEAAEASASAAQAAYDSRLAQLRAGRTTTADLFAAEGQLNQARLAVLDAAVQLRLAETRLAYAIGR